MFCCHKSILILTSIINQRDFNMAISWWMATGTCQKMESDVRNKISGQSYWIPQLMQGEVPLDIDHVLLQFFVLSTGLIISTLLFFSELSLMLYRQRTMTIPNTFLPWTILDWIKSLRSHFLEMCQKKRFTFRRLAPSWTHVMSHVAPLKLRTLDPRP